MKYKKTHLTLSEHLINSSIHLIWIIVVSWNFTSILATDTIAQYLPGIQKTDRKHNIPPLTNNMEKDRSLTSADNFLISGRVKFAWVPSEEVNLMAFLKRYELDRSVYNIVHMIIINGI